MNPTSPRGARRLAAGAGLAVLAAGLTPVAALAAPSGDGLVISEVYGGGGNSGATYTHDFVELFNPTDAAISLEGHSLKYFSSSGNPGGTTTLSGSVPAGGHFLVQQAQGSGGTTPLPDPDATGTLAMSGTNGTVELVSGATRVDLVGYGSASLFEGSAAAPGLSNTTAATRDAAGTDTDDNAADFTTAAPDPENSGGGTTPEPTCEATTIAEVQGTGAASECVGATVTVSGVVTAAYPTGGYDGYYIQTGGPDTTPEASDGIFVYDPGFDTAVAEIGATVEVTGEVTEYNGLTEINADSLSTATSAQDPVEPKAVVPGTDCALPGEECLTGAALEAELEKVEGEAFLPTADYTVTDAYDFGVSSSSFFGEIGLAAGSDIPLVTPTEVIDAQDTDAIAAREAYNTAHRVVLDDGSSANYWNTSNTAGAQDQPVPWLTADHSVRVGAAVTFEEPVVLDYRFGWKLQPQRQVVGKPEGLVTFEQDRQPAPAEVGGDLRLATFNVLNYFTTLGQDVDGCTAYVDRDDNPIATRSCPGDNGPRGAWDEASFARQEAKIVKAINALDADIVSLEELENSLVVDGGDRDEALATLVAALNADAGATRWAHVASPADVPASEDVIRNAFIYDPASVETVGESEIHDDAAFDNARDPLAQAFKGAGTPDDEAFAVIVNHFKSKGSGVDDGTGQGNANPDRIAQAESLAAFADSFAASSGTEQVFLTGDFNAYSMEDPIQALAAAGYTALKSTDDPDEETYSFSGTSGSLDHVLVNAAAREMVTGVDVWEINANESVYYQYSRFNYIGSDLYQPDVYASSDHNPELVGIELADEPEPEPTYDVSAKVTPQVVVVNRTRAMLHATVTGSAPVQGTVEVREGSTLLASGTTGNGKANLKLPRFTDTGEHVLTVSFVVGGKVVDQATVTVTVRKAASDIRVVRAKAWAGGKAVMVLRVRDEDLGRAVGWVRVKVTGAGRDKGAWRSAKLRNGKAKIRLGRFHRAGTKRVVVVYNGTSSAKRDRKVVELRVKRRR